MKHPLDSAFDVDSDREMNDEYMLVEIPDDPTLDTIISLALDAYREQMNDAMMIEPKHRAKFLEIAERFLDQAKDAMHKKESIRLQREKLLKAGSSKTATQPSTNTPTDSEEPQRKYTREELLAMNKAAGA